MNATTATSNVRRSDHLQYMEPSTVSACIRAIKYDGWEWREGCPIVCRWHPDDPADLGVVLGKTFIGTIRIFCAGKEREIKPSLASVVMLPRLDTFAGYGILYNLACKVAGMSLTVITDDETGRCGVFDGDGNDYFADGRVFPNDIEALVSVMENGNG